MIYIQKDCSEYVDLNQELDPELYSIGSTLEDYEEGKWILLTEEQLQFKNNNSSATKEEVIKMELTPDPEPSDYDKLITAKRTKENEALAFAENRYKYNLDNINIFTSKILETQYLCSFNKIITINNKEIDSNLMLLILEDLNTYCNLLFSNLNQIILSIRKSSTVEEVNSVNIESGYPEIISTTTEELNNRLNKNNKINESFQAVNFAKALINTVSLTSSQSLEMQILYPIWGQKGAEFGKSASIGFKLREVKEDSDVLFEVIQAHTIQENWKPSEATSLYKIVNEENEGTLDDPIPYSGNMILEKDKYYSQDGHIYLCTRGSETPVYNTLESLIDIYVTKIS